MRRLDRSRAPRAVPWLAFSFLLLLLLCGTPSCHCALLAQAMSPAPRTGTITAQDVHESLAAAVSDPADSTRPFAVVGYLPEYRQQGFPYADAFAHGLTHLIFFSAEVDPSSGELIHTEDRLPQGTHWDAIRAAADAHGVQLMLCIGGGGRSSGFAMMVADPIRRSQFTRQLNTLLLDKQLDGVDINWEYPMGEAQWHDFSQWVRELKSVLGYVTIWDDTPADAPQDNDATSPTVSQLFSNDVSGEGNAAEQERVLKLWRAQQPKRDFFLAERKAGKARRRNHRVRVRACTLSMAVHPHPRIASLLRELNVLPWLDYVHWMAYDYMAHTKPHSSVDYAKSVLSDQFIGAFSESVALRDPEGNERASARQQTAPTAQTKKLHRALNASKAKFGSDHRTKLTLGIPFYGRHREDPRLGPETYERLQSFIAQWVPKAHPKWRLDGTQEEIKQLNDYSGYSFNSYRDVQAKMQLARTTGPPGGIAGIMIWELGQDMLPPSTQPLSLRGAVGEQLRQWNASRPTKASVRASSRKAEPEVQQEGSSTKEEKANGAASPLQHPAKQAASSPSLLSSLGDRNPHAEEDL